MKDFLNDENTTAEEKPENNSEQAEESKGLAEDVQTEDNDNWQFEAEAHTLNGSVIDNGEFEIVIPEASKAEQPLEKPSVKPSQTVVAKAPAKKGPKGDKITFVLLSIAVALIIAACVTTGIFYYTVPSKTPDENHLKPADIAMTIGDTDVSLGMYSYYYSVVVNNYVSQAGYSNNLNTSVSYDQQTTTDDDGNTVTWQEFFDKQTEEKVKYIISYYEAGVKNNIKLSKDQKTAIKESLDSLDDYAKENGQTLDSFISSSYGEYCTYNTLEVMLNQCYIAENYYQQTQVENRATVEEETKYFEEKSKDHYSDYLSVDAALLQVSYTPGDAAAQTKAVEKANKYAKKIKSVDDMKKMIPTVYKDDIKQYVKMGYASSEEECAEIIASSMQQNYCIQKLNDSQRLDASIEKWLMASDTKKNSVKCFDMPDDGVVYIMLKASDAVLDEEKVYSVRHILIQPKSDKEEATDKFTKEQWAEAKKDADSILKKYNEGDKTEYAFAMLAEQYSEDTASTVAGGQGAFGGSIFGIKKGEMVKEFEEWAFDKKRKYGDVGIVKSQFGYHIMYFVELDKAYLQYCENAVNAEKEDKFLDGVPLKNFSKRIQKVKDAFDEAQKKAASNNQSSSGTADNTVADEVTTDAATTNPAGDTAEE